MNDIEVLEKRVITLRRHIKIMKKVIVELMYTNN